MSLQPGSCHRILGTPDSVPVRSVRVAVRVVDLYEELTNVGEVQKSYSPISPPNPTTSKSHQEAAPIAAHGCRAAAASSSVQPQAPCSGAIISVCARAQNLCSHRLNLGV